MTIQRTQTSDRRTSSKPRGDHTGVNHEKDADARQGAAIGGELLTQQSDSALAATVRTAGGTRGDKDGKRGVKPGEKGATARRVSAEKTAGTTSYVERTEAMPERAGTTDVRGAELFPEIRVGLEQALRVEGSSVSWTKEKAANGTVHDIARVADNEFRFLRTELSAPDVRAVNSKLNEITISEPHDKKSTYIHNDDGWRKKNSPGSRVWQSAMLEPGGKYSLIRNSSGETVIDTFYPNGVVVSSNSGGNVTVVLPNHAMITRTMKDGVPSISAIPGRQTGNGRADDSHALSDEQLLGKGTAGELFPELFSAFTPEKFSEELLKRYFKQLLPKRAVLKLPTAVEVGGNAEPQMIDRAARAAARENNRPVVIESKTGTPIIYIPDVENDRHNPEYIAQEAYRLSKEHGDGPVDVKWKGITIHANNDEMLEPAINYLELPASKSEIEERIKKWYANQFHSGEKILEELKDISQKAGGSAEEIARDVFRIPSSDLELHSDAQTHARAMKVANLIEQAPHVTGRPITIHEVGKNGNVLQSFTVKPETIWWQAGNDRHTGDSRVGAPDGKETRNTNGDAGDIENIEALMNPDDTKRANEGLRRLSKGATNVLATLHKLDEGGVLALVKNPEQWLRESEVGKVIREEIARITDLNERQSLRDGLKVWFERTQRERARTERGGTGIGAAYGLGVAEDWLNTLLQIVIP